MPDDILSRRSLLKVSLLVGGGFMLAMRLPSLARAQDIANAEAATPGEFVPNAFVLIDPAGVITFTMPHTEVGQGIYTSSAMLIGEELEVGLDQIQLRPAPPDLLKYMDPNLGDQATGGSASTRGDWVRLRQAGAAARIMLIAAAAKRWSVDPATCHAQRGVIHDSTGRSLGYGDVATKLDLIGEQAVEGVVRHGDEDEVGILAADLETEAGAGKLNEGRRAPAMAGAAGDDSLAVLSADDEGALLEAGDNGDAGGAGGDVFRDALVGCGHELVENHVCGFDAVVKLLHVGCVRAESEGG